MTVPPYETSGKGTPTTGTRPRTMATLNRMKNATVATQPTAGIILHDDENDDHS